MSEWCGNRSPITGECILGCPGIGGCKRGLETPERPHSVVGELARVKALFQARTLATLLGAPMPKPEDFKQ